MADEPSPVKTINRLVRVLDCFSPDRPMWTLAELSAHLDLPKSTLHRFLLSLDAHGILRREADDKRWRLGYHLFAWGNLAAESTDLRVIAHPVLRDLVVATGESAILTVYQNGVVLCLDKVETTQPVRMTMTIGARRPAHAGSSSKVLMAYLPEDEVKAIIREQGLPKLCTNTITTREALLAELDCIRQQGFARSCEETDRSAWGIAAPIFGWQAEQVVAAIGIAGPTSRYDEKLMKKHIAACRQAADRLSQHLRSGHGANGSVD
jgi:DNA-binding IclR family transcriptional regulator